MMYTTVSLELTQLDFFDTLFFQNFDRISKFDERISKFVDRISKFDNIERGVRFVIRRLGSNPTSGVACIGQLRSVYNFSRLYSTSDRFKPGVQILLLSLSNFADR